MRYSLLIVLSILTILSACKKDERPLEIQLKEVLIEGLKEYQVNGASVAVILPDRNIKKVTAGYSNDTVAELLRLCRIRFN